MFSAESNQSNSSLATRKHWQVWVLEEREIGTLRNLHLLCCSESLEMLRMKAQKHGGPHLPSQCLGGGGKVLDAKALLIVSYTVRSRRAEKLTLKRAGGDEETAQWSRALAAPAQDGSWFLSTHTGQLTTPPREDLTSSAFFMGNPQTHVHAQRCMDSGNDV